MAHKGLSVQLDFKDPSAHKDLSVQLDLKDLSAHKGRKETRVLLASRVLLERLELQAPPAILAQRGLPAKLDRPGRKVPQARAEGLTASRNSRAAAHSWCQLESAG